MSLFPLSQSESFKRESQIPMKHNNALLIAGIMFFCLNTCNYDSSIKLHDPFWGSITPYDVVTIEKDSNLCGIWQTFRDSTNGYNSVNLLLYNSSYTIVEYINCQPFDLCAPTVEKGDWGSTKDSLQLRPEGMKTAHVFKYMIKMDSLFLFTNNETRFLRKYSKDLSQ